MVNLSSFDLNLLRVLDALLRTHSTVRAAHLVGLSQPAVSAALGRLRLALGDELFFRQGLAPTQFAQSLEAPLRNLLDQMETLLQGPADFDPTRSERNFKISGSDFFAEMLMPSLAERLQSVAPAMRVHLVDFVQDSYLNMMEEHEIDLALLPNIDLPDWAESRVMFQSGFSVIARKDHPRFEQAGVQPDAMVPIDLYCDLGHVLFSTQGNSSAMGDSALAAIGRKRRVVMTMPVFSGVYRAVAGSDLIALLPTAFARRIAPAANLSVYKMPMRIKNTQIVMVWHRRHSASPAHIWLRGQVAGLLSPFDEASAPDD
ncbi:LysR family transcriptional regulator [Neptunicoccus cionae]|uniref:Transcriptional regulator n=1 Tax=Neptunicoccus cionae TaxID=2035344 RepID=A0A916QUR7_9RHOB|nr:LysR family transcriptional regulator [Amylibacter cionae]GGA08921.1 transcriptional regulator [Amylibacter cionae]